MAKKIMLAICSKDKEYKERLIRCMMNHYKEQYELHSMESLEEGLKEDVDLVLTDMKDEAEACFTIQKDCIFLCESIEVKKEEKAIYKYQEVYKIHNKIQQDVYPKQVNLGAEMDISITGVYSMGCENQQLPFCALLAEEYAKEGRTLLMNLQEGSRISKGSVGMEDLMTVAKTGNYTKKRLQAAIGEEKNWEYVYELCNSECLAEGTGILFAKMIKLLVEELAYQKIIINFGSIFIGMHEWMSSCDAFYFLTNDQSAGGYREQEFLQELDAKGYQAFLEEMHFLKVPMVSSGQGDWRALVQQWKYMGLADEVRKQIWKK